MTPADAERARSWTIEIATTLLPEGTQWRDEGPDRRFLHNGGLLIHRTKGCWYSHALGKGGWSAVSLIELLKGCSTDEAMAWAAAWLANPKHDGTGSCNGVSDDEDDGAAVSASADSAREILASLVDVSGTPVEPYLKARWIEPPFPDCIKFLPNARAGEGGLVYPLTSHGRIVGVQVGYLDPDGQRSTVEPKRRRFMLERVQDAVFELPYSGENGGVIVAEGLEDGLSVWRWGARRCRVLGVPGIATLQHLQLAKGVRVTVVRDGDTPGSTADKALQVGLDRLLLAGVDVYVTATPPPGQDANSILQAAGVDGLRLLLDSAAPAVLSLRGEIERLAQLEELDYVAVRKTAAKRLKIPVAVLDAEVRKARAAAATGSAPKQDWFNVGDTQPWPDPVDGTDLLDDIEKLIGSFVVMTNEQRWTIALWVIFSHCFDAAINAAKLWIKSAERRSGKTRIMEILEHLTPRAVRADSITAAMIPRVIEGWHPTLLLDEFDTLIKDNEALRGVLNSGFDRGTVIIIGVKVGEDWEPRPFSPWCPQALAGIGDLPDTIADRSFKIELERKPRNKKVSRLRRRDTGPLTELAQKAARWAADNVQALSEAEPVMPVGLNDRAADAWELCIAIADRAGGHWPQRARRAALKISGDDALADDESLGVQLLADIRDIFEKLNSKEPDKKEQRLHSADIVEQLADLEHRPWAEFRRDRSITTPQLAQLLRKYHISPRQLRIGTDNAKGYRRTQFERAFERYLPPLPDPPPEDFSPAPPNRKAWTETSKQPEDSCGSQTNFRPKQEETCFGLKNPGDPSVSASCFDVSGGPPLMAGVEDRNSEEQTTTPSSLAEKLAEKLGSVPQAPNSSITDPDSEHRPSTIEAKILEVKAENPRRSAAWIGKQVGRPASVVRRILANNASPPEAGVA